MRDVDPYLLPMRFQGRRLNRPQGTDKAIRQPSACVPHQQAGERLSWQAK